MAFRKASNPLCRAVIHSAPQAYDIEASHCPGVGGATDAMALPCVASHPRGRRELLLPLILHGALPTQHPTDVGQLMPRKPHLPLPGARSEEHVHRRYNIADLAPKGRSSASSRHAVDTQSRFSRHRSSFQGRRVRPCKGSVDGCADLTPESHKSGCVGPPTLRNGVSSHGFGRTWEFRALGSPQDPKVLNVWEH